MAAAVADYAPAERAAQKIAEERRSRMTLVLKRTPDILGELGQRRLATGARAAAGRLRRRDRGRRRARDREARKQARRPDRRQRRVARPTPASTSTPTRSRIVGADGAEALPLQSKARVAAADSRIASKAAARQSSTQRPPVGGPPHGSRSTRRTSEVRRRARRRRRQPRSRLAHARDDAPSCQPLRSRAEPAAAASADSSVAPLVALSRSAAEALAAVRADIGATARAASCTRSGGKQIVFGVGNPERRSDVRRRGAGRRRRRPGHSVRRPRRAAADEDHRGDRPASARTSTSRTSSSAGRRRTAIPSRTRSRPASRFCSGRSTPSSRR